MDMDAEPAVANQTTPSLQEHCFLTRGAEADVWHLWNSSRSALALRKDDIARVHAVRSDMERTTFCQLRIVRDVAVPGLKDRRCVAGHDIELQEPLADVSLAAADSELVRMCMSKGIKCAAFLEHYVKRADTEELDLGERMHSLFVCATREMLTRKYDIMHHYPLFNRMMSIYYVEKDTTAPPSLQDVIDHGGLLDKSVGEHESLHGLSVTGLDHLAFKRWNYPYVKDNSLDVTCGEDEPAEPAQVITPELKFELQSDPKSESLTSDRTFVNRDSVAEREVKPTDGVHQRPTTPGSPFLTTHAPSHTAPSQQRVEHDGTIHWFNNHPGTLTDRPAAFPCRFAVHVGQGVTFNDLIQYCVTREPQAQIGSLPSRREWGSVNPVLLMEDNVDPATGKTAHSYVVTSRGHLSELTTRPCYNEVFLPGRPVTRLNLDVDMKCCASCHARYTVKANCATRRKVSRAMASSLLLVVAESLLSMVNATPTAQRAQRPNSPPDGVSLKELTRAIGKVAVYIRSSSVQSKLSLRMLWYLPVELCSVRGIEAYRPLLQEMEKVSLRYLLLSYPEETRACSLCDLSKAISQSASKNDVRCLRLSADAPRKTTRRSAIDKAPYAFRKSVRLPNCYKQGTGFEYVETFNDQINLPGSGFDHHLSLSVGLSSNPIADDVTFLGDRFTDLLKERQGLPAIQFDAEEDSPDGERVENEAKRLMDLWGVPVTVRQTGTGLFCVQATEKSTTYPCPKHNRVHSTSKLSALVFATQTKHKCFVT